MLFFYVMLDWVKRHKNFFISCEIKKKERMKICFQFVSSLYGLTWNKALSTSFTLQRSKPISCCRVRLSRASLRFHQGVYTTLEYIPTIGNRDTKKQNQPRISLWHPQLRLERHVGIATFLINTGKKEQWYVENKRTHPRGRHDHLKDRARNEWSAPTYRVKIKHRKSYL